MVGGRDFSWRGGDAKVFEAVNAKPAAAHIEITPDAGLAAQVKATLGSGVRSDDLALLVAITQNGLVSQVTAGENRGAALRHDFVVRDLKTQRLGSAASLDARFAFSARPDWNPARMSLVAFVQNTRTGEVLQALSAPACP
jgi:hypothetical protein